MQSNKQVSNESQYIEKLKEYKIASDFRKPFYANFTLPTFHGKTQDGKTISPSNLGEAATLGSVVFNGKLPTVDQYKGPDTYVHPVWGTYQTGLRAKIAGTDQWNEEILAQASKVGVNPLAIKIFMAVETGGHHSTSINAWDCVGLMQVQIKNIAEPNRSKIINDPAFNIYYGCKIAMGKHAYAKNLIKNEGDKYTRYKNMGYELKPNIFGVAWLYNGFNISETNKSANGALYGYQVAAMYQGFGRDPFTDTVLTLDVLGG
jgi:hypothetical protein